MELPIIVQIKVCHSDCVGHTVQIMIVGRYYEQSNMVCL